MSRLRRIEILEPYYSLPLLFKETSIFTRQTLPFPSFFEQDSDLSFALDCFNPSSFEIFDAFTDLCLIEKTPSICSYKKVQSPVGTELYLESLCDRVSRLESRFDRIASAKKIESGDRKYSWTAEIQSPEKNGFDRKYKLTKEIKGGKKTGCKWTAEIKGKGEGEGVVRKYTIEADEVHCIKSEKKHKKKEKKGLDDARVVGIEENGGHGAAVLRQAFAKRAGAARNAKGKKKELSLQDAAMMIQMSFRAYLIRRSQALRALRELAVAKAKLKELRALFNNFSYRRRIVSDAEERQRFSEKIIVLLLTVDAIEGADVMVRSAKRSMIDELEAMLDVVDPQPAGRSLSMRRRTFDMPDGAINKEIAANVAQVVQMLDRAENSADTFEACL